MLVITKLNAFALALFICIASVLGTAVIEQGMAYIDVGFGLHPMLASFIVLVLMFLVAGAFVLIYEERDEHRPVVL